MMVLAKIQKRSVRENIIFELDTEIHTINRLEIQIFSKLEKEIANIKIFWSELNAKNAIPALGHHSC
jgi:hypothetical protein